MGSNGIVKENAWKNVDQEKFNENHEKIFGKYEKIICGHCDLSSRQKVGVIEWLCPHCENRNTIEVVKDL